MSKSSRLLRSYGAGESAAGAGNDTAASNAAISPLESPKSKPGQERELYSRRRNPSTFGSCPANPDLTIFAPSD